MKPRIWSSLLGIALLSTHAGAQGSAEPIVHPETIVESIIRIRTVADLRLGGAGTDGRVGGPSGPYSIDATGVVIGETMVSGRREYYILTNHHVADASNYVLEDGGSLRMNPDNTASVPRVREESYLLGSADDIVTDQTPRLIEVVRRVEGDMTLMRTSGIQHELTVFEGDIGYSEGEILAGTAVVTGGYPWGGDRIVASGSVLAVDHRHELGPPHHDFLVDLPVEPGQSGGPIFLVEQSSTGEESYRLIGLIHARDSERNYGVTYRGWGDSLDDFPPELQERMIF